MQQFSPAPLPSPTVCIWGHGWTSTCTCMSRWPPASGWSTSRFAAWRWLLRRHRNGRPQDPASYLKHTCRQIHHLNVHVDKGLWDYIVPEMKRNTIWMWWIRGCGIIWIFDNLRPLKIPKHYEQACDDGVWVCLTRDLSVCACVQG